MASIPGFHPDPGGKAHLIVALHGYLGSPKRLAPLLFVAAKAVGSADVYAPQLPMGALSTAQPETIVAGLVAAIDRIVAKRIQAHGAGYAKIYLIGHSLGALLVRQTYIAGCRAAAAAAAEARTSDPSAEAPYHWAQSVDRILLLAGMNRGWQISHHLSLSNAIKWSAGTLAAAVYRQVRARPLIFSIRRGAPFLTRLRIEWIEMRRDAARSRFGGALTIQLLGSIDDMVSPEDNIDLVSGQDFIYLDVPFSGHDSVIDLADPTPAPPGMIGGGQSVGAARTRTVTTALTASQLELDRIALYPSDEKPERSDPSVTDVVFVVHGIRDEGYWTHKIARRILRVAKNRDASIRIATETSSYGYFPMLSFVLPWRRRARVEWLMDQYAESLARYPNASISFVGHSNGTYLLARALQDYDFCRFKHVVFAGSVVDGAFDWARMKAEGRVGAVLNYVASGDWVVAFFPKAIGMLRIQDLGGAGHDGFDGLGSAGNVRFVSGGHSAALDEANWDSIAEFILTGKRAEPPASVSSPRRKWWVALGGFFPPAVIALAGALLAGLGALIVWPIDGFVSVRSLLVAAYVWLLWRIARWI